MVDSNTHDISNILKLVENRNFDKLDFSSAQDALLRDYECWSPLVEIYKEKTTTSDLAIKLLIEIAYIQLNFLEDFSATYNMCNKIIVENKVGFDFFKEKIVDYIIPSTDFFIELELLIHIKNSFANQEDKIKCLERICFILEKKIHQEDKLTMYYEELLDLDPKSIKSLKFFKLIATQSADWAQVAKILFRLLEAHTHTSHKSRDAHELATILIYQLDQPAIAIKILNQYCKNNELDISTALYDGYEAIGDWQSLAKILQNYLKKADSLIEKSGLNYRLGIIFQKLEKHQKAISFFEAALDNCPDPLPIYEGIVDSYIVLENWNKIDETLKKIAECCEDESRKDQIELTIKRIFEGSENKNVS